MMATTVITMIWRILGLWRKKTLLSMTKWLFLSLLMTISICFRATWKSSLNRPIMCKDVRSWE